ncbi:hypothetical protein, partial [Paraburkholderia sp. BR14264]|uniref:hypothetical protein n=1 Tax=Paraburkholderia sp. BR14264 TaxID=3237001 RepID=UPI0039781DE0
LVTKEPRGRTRIVRADPGQIDRVRGLLDAYADLWRGRIDRLDALLGEDRALRDDHDREHDREQGSH